MLERRWTPAATVYIDQSFAGTTAGQNPATAPTGLILQFGVDAFADIQSGLDNLASGGTAVIFADTTDYAGFSVNNPVAAFDIEQNPQNPSGSGLVVINTPVTLNHDVVFTQAAIQPGTNQLAAADLEFDGNIVTNGTPVSLTINGNSNRDIFEAIGTLLHPLSLVNVASASQVTLQQDVSTSTTQVYNAPVRIEDSGTLTMTGSTITFDSTVESLVRHGDLTVTGDAEFDGVVGASGNTLGNLQVTGATTINTTAVTTSGTQTYNYVYLGATTTLSSSGGHDITFGGDIESSIALRYGLTVDTSGTTIFSGIVGASGSTLAALTTDAGGSTEINGNSVLTDTIGVTQTYNDNVTFGAASPYLVGNATFNAGLTLGASATTATSTLQVYGDLSFASTATLTSTFAGTAVGDYGQVIVSGTTNFNSALLDVSPNAFSPALTDSFDVVSSNSVVGQFSNATSPGPIEYNGTWYLVTYSGGSGGADFVLTAGPFSVSGSSLIASGTSGNDQFSLTGGATTFTAVVNGQSGTFSGSLYTTVVFMGNGGNDTSTVLGLQGTSNASLSPTSATITGSGYTYEIDDSTTIYVFGNAGDTASLADTSGDDLFYALPAYSLMQNASTNASTYVEEAIGFGTVSASATTGNDIAYLYDSSGNDTYTSDATGSQMAGSGYQARTVGFDMAYGFFFNGGTDTANVGPASGTNNYVYGTAGDTANLSDSAGDDTFFAVPKFGYSYLQGSGFVDEAMTFGTIAATSSAGGTDTAEFYDTSGNDTFTSSGNASSLTSGNVLNTATGFAINYAFFTAGGTDTANLQAGTARANYVNGTSADTANFFDSAGNDIFYGTPAYSYMNYNSGSYVSEAIGFGRVNANATAGGTDQAYLYDSPGNDSIVVGGSTATLNLATPPSVIQVNHFDSVFATSSQGGTDTEHVTAHDFYFQAIGNWVDV